MTPTLHDAAADQRLGQLLRALIAICFGGVLLDVVLGLAFNSATLYTIAVVTAGIGVLALTALWLARAGKIHQAAYTAGATFLAGATLFAVFLPALSATMTMVPLLVIALLLPYLAPRATLSISILCVLITPAIFLLNTLAPPFVEPPPRSTALLLGTIGVCVVPALTALLLWQYNARITATVAQTQASNAALEQARATLEQQVEARTAELRGALVDVQERAAAQAQLLEENAGQRAQIREMSVPILPVSGNTIAIPLVGELDTERLEALQEQVLNTLTGSSIRYALIDITGVPLVDTHVAQGIISVVTAARLLGTEVVLVGVRPEVAQAVVSLGLDLHAITTRRSLHEGIAYSERGARSEERGARSEERGARSGK